tara:strand:- start:158 stop:505 length:348 start_codon:yes stop_codon:yes gene_type:complete
MKLTIRDAITTVCSENHPNSGIRIIGKDAELLSLDCLTLMDGTTPSFTWDDVETKKDALIAEFTANEYSRNRASAYDSIGNQLDLLFHDMTAGKGTKTGEWYKAVAKVKADNPKG